MNEILLTVVTWIHLLSTVVWIGGIFFILSVALPIAKKTLEQPGKLMGAIGKRFVPMANISILLIFITGIFMSLLSHSFSELVSLNSPWSRILFIKILAALMMAGIHFYRDLLLTPKIERLTAEVSPSGKIKELQRLSLNLVKINLILGTVVLFLTGMLSAFSTLI